MAKVDQETEHADDVADVRAQLKLAQERLATYQKFDRDIAENVRRSSELMLEAMQVRDRMDHEATVQAKARQERLATRLKAMQADLEGIQEQVGTMLERVATLRDDIESESAEDEAGEASGNSDGETGSPEEDESARGRDGDAPDDDDQEATEAAAPEPRAIDVIAHGMTRAASALALQSHLRGLAQVETVDAREFSSGILRLQLSIVAELPDDDLVGWEGDDDVTIIRHQDDAIELRLGE